MKDQPRIVKIGDFIITEPEYLGEDRIMIHTISGDGRSFRRKELEKLISEFFQQGVLVNEIR